VIALSYEAGDLVAYQEFILSLGITQRRKKMPTLVVGPRIRERPGRGEDNTHTGVVNLFVQDVSFSCAANVRRSFDRFVFVFALRCRIEAWYRRCHMDDSGILPYAIWACCPWSSLSRLSEINYLRTRFNCTSVETAKICASNRSDAVPICVWYGGRLSWNAICKAAYLGWPRSF